MKILSLVFSILISVSVVGQRFDDILITTHKVNDQISVLFGAGGNIAIFHGPDGILMVDDQFAELAPKINEAIDAISDHQVRYLVNTHWHGDHTGGNQSFAEGGAVIVAHDAVKQRLSERQVRPFQRSVDAAPPGAWPTLTFNEEMKIHFNGESVHLLHVHNAHTDGDAFVYFPKYNVLHMGDTFFRNKFPYIDLDSGGSPEGCIAAVEAALMMCDADTQIIPGHGAVSSKDDLSRYLQMLKIVTDRVQKSITNGVGMDAIPVEEITKGFDGWGDGFIKADVFCKTLFKAYQPEDVMDEPSRKRRVKK